MPRCFWCRATNRSLAFSTWQLPMYCPPPADRSRTQAPPIAASTRPVPFDNLIRRGKSATPPPGRPSAAARPACHRRSAAPRRPTRPSGRSACRRCSTQETAARNRRSRARSLVWIFGSCCTRPYSRANWSSRKNGSTPPPPDRVVLPPEERLPNSRQRNLALGSSIPSGASLYLGGEARFWCCLSVEVATRHVIDPLSTLGDVALDRAVGRTTRARGLRTRGGHAGRC